MNILKYHYEKLILGLILLAMLLYLLNLMQNLNELRSTEAERFLPSPSNREKTVEQLKASDFNTLKLIDTTGLRWSSGSDRKDTLFFPGKYIECVNPDCNHWLPFNAAKCPWCQTKQKVDGEPPPKEDTDDDGIKDSVEERYDFLNPNNPEDANRDFDDDWFTNKEEINLGTSPEDKTDHPLLAHNVQLISVKQDRLNLEFKNITGESEEDKEKWDIAINVLTDGRWKTKFANIGDTIKGYRIIDVNKKTELVYSPTFVDEVEKDVSTLTLKSNDKAPITITRGERPTVGKQIFIRLYTSATDADKYEEHRINAGKTLSLTDINDKTEEYKTNVISSEKVEFDCINRPAGDTVTVTKELPDKFRTSTRNQQQFQQFEGERPYPGVLRPESPGR